MAGLSTLSFLLSVCAGGLCSTSWHHLQTADMQVAERVCESSKQEALREYPLVFCHCCYWRSFWSSTTVAAGSPEALETKAKEMKTP